MSDLFSNDVLDGIIAAGDKDALQDYAKAQHGKELDMLQPFDTLVAEVQALAAPAPSATETTSERRRVGRPRKATHLLNRATGLFFPRTDLLEARGDLTPCDDRGIPV